MRAGQSPFIAMNEEGGKHLSLTLTRIVFNELTHDLVERTVIPVHNALRDAKISASDLSKVLLVGGATRIPAVQEMVHRLTGKEPAKRLNPDECVALGRCGAGRQAGR